jgi:hypothetical protein
MGDTFGGFSDKALEAYKQALAEQAGTDFAESDLYDFTRCIRPNGKAYGTGGQCRKGTEEAKTVEDKPARARRESKTDRLTREVARTGGQIPGVAKPWTAEEKKAISERNKKSLEAEAKRKEVIQAKDTKVKGMAEQMVNKQGVAADHPHRENIVNNHVGEINRLRYNSRNKDIQDMISRGDHEGISRLAQARMGEPGEKSKERIAQAAATERAKQRASLKEDLANAPKEEHARIKELRAYEAKKEIARAKERAQQEENALFNIGFALKGK